MNQTKEIILRQSKIKHAVFTVFIPHTVHGSQNWSNWHMAEVVSELLDDDQKLTGIEWLADGFEITYTQKGI